MFGSIMTFGMIAGTNTYYVSDIEGVEKSIIGVSIVYVSGT